MLLWKIGIRLSFEWVFLPPEIYPGVEPLYHMILLFLVFWGTSLLFPWWLRQCTFPLTVYMDSPCSTSSPAFAICSYSDGLHRWLSGKESTCQRRRPGFDSWVRKIPWRRKWQPTPAFVPWESLGQRSLTGYRGCRVRHHWACTEPFWEVWGGSSLEFWFAFPWLVMLSIFSCAW